VASTDDSLSTVASDLLGAAVEILDWTARAVVTIGVPAYDCCPMLAVWVQRVEEAAVGPVAPSSGDSASRIPHRLGRVIQVTLQIEVIGCVPEANLSGSKLIPPTVARLNASSVESYAWGWRLRNGLAQKLRDGDLFGGSCTFKDLGITQPITPEGGCGGWILPVVVQLDGYDPL